MNALAYKLIDENTWTKYFATRLHCLPESKGNWFTNYGPTAEVMQCGGISLGYYFFLNSYT
jgi:hypothetical protein